MKAGNRVLPRAQKISHPDCSKSQLDCQACFHFLLWSQTVILSDSTLPALAKAHWLVSLTSLGETEGLNLAGLHRLVTATDCGSGDRSC